MPGFEDLIFRIKSQNPIENIIGEYVELKKTGKNFKGLCPFHDEKTPSFIVSPDKAFYHCFGCKASGDIIKFIEEIEHISFMESLELLAEKSGIDITQYKGHFQKGDSAEIIGANETAAIFYNNELKYSKPAYDYLIKRGLRKKHIDLFKLGFAKYGNALTKHITSKKLSFNEFEKAGLIMKSGNGYRDRFYNRIMFPISNHSGKTIGFGGRIFEGEGPKYINSSENTVFKKGYYLYGLNMSKKVIRQKSIAVITEGYMDFISLYKAGVDNAVAQLGTACSSMQANLISRMAEKVILMYDADDAGINAALRSIPILLKENIAVDVFIYEKYKDPDEIVEKESSIDLEYIKKHSVDFIEFAKRYESRNMDDEIIRKKHIITFISNAIRLVTNNALKNVYINIASENLDINKSVFWEENASLKFREKKKKNVVVEKTNILYTELISLMLSNNDLAIECCEGIDDAEYYDIKTKNTFIQICNNLENTDNIVDNSSKNVNINSLDEKIIERIFYYENKKPDIKKTRKVIELIKRDGIMRKIEENESKKKHIKDDEERKRLDQMNIFLRKKLKRGGIEYDR